ncbi:GNAT family N-acetyltransferase [Larsenimonas suaedae]|uniref:GNAT family N-acetyltransferase n=1 Tax=Larsenimonas suaedae TaxID=1851019 RepID=A0ABU1GXC8_9GAMM|nr:GNAT family N-acetyltransferase [Larsenimonas suaedae]MCM2971393.1 GNAT family N-acetyltransferase [Larsenimonas suaedae]MDR5896649.1 GNAT family N-acetyltransferase [Larsenimonas suaedae]
MQENGLGLQFVERFFQPRSILIVLDSEHLDLARTVLANLSEGGFNGRLGVYGLDDSAGEVTMKGLERVPELKALSPPPDLILFVCRVECVPEPLTTLAERGCAAALIMTGGAHWSESPASEPDSLRARLGTIVTRFGLRIMGPECAGILSTRHNLNASCTSTAIARGRLAYLGQSGMVGHALIDWAAERGIGFSHMVALGDSVDVTLPDVLDYLNLSGGYRALVMHLERIDNARHFMTALREAARHHVVVAIKSGRFERTDLARHGVAPGLSRRDQVLDAALERAGVLRVNASDELIDALETLTRVQSMPGDRVAFVANGLGLSFMAMDALIAQGGTLASLSDATCDALTAQALDVSVRGDNPVDVGSLATPEVFERAVRLVGADPNVDVVITIHAPTRMAPAEEVARRVVASRDAVRGVLMSCWMGLKTAREARLQCQRAGIAHYRSPEKAVDGVMLMVRYRKAQHLLRLTPPNAELVGRDHRRENAQRLIREAFERQRRALTHQECGEVLDAYGVSLGRVHYLQATHSEPVLPAFAPPWQMQAVHEQACMPFSVSDTAECVLRRLTTPIALQEAFAELKARFEARDTPLYSVCVRPERSDVASVGLSVGITRDPVFGPVVFIGRAGHPLDEAEDRHVALPPLNRELAHTLIDQTSARHLLTEQLGSEAWRERLARLLVTLSTLATDVPTLECLNISPLRVSATDVWAEDYRLSVGPPARFAIMPYPDQWVNEELLSEGDSITIRPIRESDAALITEFHRHLSARSIRFRYFRDKPELSQEALARLAQLNYDRQMAFVALESVPKWGSSSGEALGESVTMLGVARVWNDPDNVRTEFSIIIRDDMQGRGLGRRLMTRLIDYSRHVGTLEMYGKIAPDNRAMRALVKALGFTTRLDMEEGVVTARLALNEPATAWQRQRLAQTDP